MTKRRRKTRRACVRAHKRVVCGPIVKAGKHRRRRRRRRSRK